MRQDDDVVSRSNAAVAREAGSRATRAPEVREPAAPDVAPEVAQIDRVLDKISQEGINSLTADERTLLDNVSRRLREL